MNSHCHCQPFASFYLTICRLIHKVSVMESLSLTRALVKRHAFSVVKIRANVDPNFYGLLEGVSSYVQHLWSDYCVCDFQLPLFIYVSDIYAYLPRRHFP